MVTTEERQLIDLLIDFGSQTAGELDFHIVQSLYRKGLIYLDVPVTAVDRVQVPPLQGFVMNRVLGDYFETLLYKIFVSIDEHITVDEVISFCLFTYTKKKNNPLKTIFNIFWSYRKIKIKKITSRAIRFVQII